MSKNWDVGNAQYADIINTASVAAENRPGDINYRYWLNFYRWKSITARPVVNAAEYFPMIAEQLHAARWLCPTHGPTNLLLGRIESDMPDRRAQAAADLRRAFELSGPDPIAALAVGQLDASEGNTAQALIHLRCAAEIDRRLIPDVIDVCVTQMQRPDLALQLASDDVDALNILVRVLANDPATQALADQARDRAFNAVLVQAQDPDAAAPVLAQTADALVEREQLEEAITYYRRALNLDYGQIEWRMKLAKVLAKLDRNDEAIHEAEICLRRRELREARELIARLSQSSSAGGTGAASNLRDKASD